MPRQRLGVALLVPEPLATELDGLRRALGAAERALVQPHLTLVSPTNVRDDEVQGVLDGVRRAANRTYGPLTLELGPVGTFAPVTPTVHLRVSGDIEPLTTLRALVRQGPLDRPEPFEWVQHVTLAQEVADEVIEAALVAMGAFSAPVAFDAVDVLRQHADRVWRSIDSMPFAGQTSPPPSGP